MAHRWPQTNLMLCASGGGRTDLGTLRWFHDVWLSDNTDAVARLRMQWEASRFLAPLAIAAHVTRWGDQDLAFACAVAMSARFGFDLDPSTLRPAELAACQRASAIYREIRDLAQRGDLYRLIPPDGDRAALAYADSDRAHLVVFGYQLARPTPADAAGPDGPDADGPCPVAGIREGPDYRVRRLSRENGEEDSCVRPGRALLADGLAWPLRRARTAALWRIDVPD